MAFSPLQTYVILVALSSTLLFFFISPHTVAPNLSRRSLLNSINPTDSCSSILQTIPTHRCRFSLDHCNGESRAFFNYYSLHFCIFHENPFLTIPFLALLLLFHFYILVKTAQDRFSVVVTKLADHLNLSPSMAAVTLLALGNGAPDVFASLAAVRGGHPRTGFGAILSAGTFVSAFVVGFVAILAAPFSVDPAPFVRDVFFYLMAASFMFYVYLSAEIFLWQAIGFVGLYMLFVGLVFWMDSRKDMVKRKGADELRLINGEVQKSSIALDYEAGGIMAEKEQKPASGFCQALGTISMIWEFPVNLILKLTIPATEPHEWSRFYTSANIAFCPLLLVYTCATSFIVSLNNPISFIGNLPLWLLLIFPAFSLSLLHFTLEKKPPEEERIQAVIAAFAMSVFWISTVAGELLSCLAAVGSVLGLPPAILGLTVLAWGNSAGDLVADVAVAKAGQPALAMAGCFAGPMFNMLVGLGAALVMESADVFPDAYELRFHVGLVIAFVFLLMSLMGSLLVITWSRFWVSRCWGFCLIALYVVFVAISLLVATFSI